MSPFPFDRKTRSDRTLSPANDRRVASQERIYYWKTRNPPRDRLFFLILAPSSTATSPSRSKLERPLRTSSGSRQTGLSVLSLAPWSLGVGCNKGGTRGRSNLEKGRPDFWSGAGEREKDKSLDALNTGGGNWISVIMCIYDGLLPSAMLWERQRERIYDMFIYVVRRGK